MKIKCLWLLLLSSAVFADNRDREYGVATTINICLPSYSEPRDFEPSATFAVGDVMIMQNEAVEVEIDTLPSDEGSCYSLGLTAVEMQAARISIRIEDQDATKIWMDTSIYIETYGNALAQNPNLVAPTAIQNRQEMDANSTQLAKLGTPVTDISADISAIPTAILAATIDGSIDLQCAMALITSYTSGKWTTSGGVVTYRDPGDANNRVVGTIASSSFDSITLTCP